MVTTTMQLNFINQTILPKTNSRIFQPKNTCYVCNAYVQNHGLYSVNTVNRTWKANTIKDIDDNIGHKLQHVFEISDQEDLLIFTTTEALNFYLSNGQNITLAGVYYTFNSNFNWNTGGDEIIFGNFYHDSSRMGLITSTATQDQDHKIQFYEILKDKTDEKQIKLHSVYIDTIILNQFCPGDYKLLLTELKKNESELLLCRYATGLSLFRFTLGDGIQHEMNIMLSNDHLRDSLYFPNLSIEDDWNDIVIVNASGMFVFQYDPISSDAYKLINYNGMFSMAKGWKSKYTKTIQFQDINNDGSDDIIFIGNRGIEILTYNVHDNKQWKSFLNTENLEPQKRYASAIYSVKQKINDKQLFHNVVFLLYYSEKFHLANAIEIPLESVATPQIIQKSHAILSETVPLEIVSAIPERKSIIYLRDQSYNYYQSMKLLDYHTGKAKFVLPLIGEFSSTMKFNLFYDGNVRSNEPFGIGWYMPQSYIILYYKESNFQEDEYYVLVFDNVPHKLELISAESTETTFSFEIEGKGAKMKIQANYNSIKSKWEINYGNDHKQYYGYYEEGHWGAIGTDSAWADWRGRGFDEINFIHRVHVWYLAVAHINGLKSYFQYSESNLSTNSSANSTKFIHLTKIYNDFEMIEFSHTCMMDKFNRSLKVITGYTYNSEISHQTVIFKYSIDSSTLLLTGIEQKSDYLPEPVFQFKYLKFKKEKYYLNEIVVPKLSKITYDYTSLGKFTSIAEQTHRTLLTFGDDYIVSYGPDFTLVTYLDKNLKRVIIRMFNNDLTKEISTFSSILAYSQKSLGFEVLIANTFIAIILYAGEIKSTYVYGRFEDGTWQTQPRCYNSSEEATILNGNNFIVVSDPISNVTVIDWEQVNNNWTSTFLLNNTKTITSLAVHDNKIVIYNNIDIFLAYKNGTKQNKWILHKLCHIHGFLSETRKFLYKFRLKKDFERALIGFFRNNAIQISHNIVVLSGLVQDIQGFSTRIKIFMIGRDHNVRRNFSMLVTQDIFSKLTSQEETTQGGDFYNLTYILKSDVIRVKLKDFRSASGKSFEYFDKKIEKEMNFPAERFLLDLKNYHVTLHGQMIRCRDKIFVFGGNYWYEKSTAQNISKNVSIPLGNNLFIYKSNAQSSVKLYNKEKTRMLFNFGIRNMSDLIIHYPIYIAAQEKGSVLKLIEFMEGNELLFKKTVFPLSMQLSQFSSAKSLVTYENNLNDTKTLTIWPLYGARRFYSNKVVKSVKISTQEKNGSIERITAYKYLESSLKLLGNKIFYTHMSIFPGNDKTAYGYSSIVDQFVEIYDGDEKLVKKIQRQNQEEEDNDDDNDDDKGKLRKDEIFFDKSNRFEIARVSPFSKTSNMFGFIGFEDYEDITENWTFNEEGIIRGRFSLTGKNYFSLKNRSLKGTFQPQFQDRQFIVSSWIRIPIETIPKLGDYVPYMWVSILSNDGRNIFNLMANVKFKIKDWFYLEIVIDFQFTHLMLKSTDYDHHDSNNLQLKINLCPTSGISIDVDNVRFNPINNKFEVNIYDELLDKVIAILTSSGSMKRNFYDKYLVQIAETNESNQIKEFITYTKASYHTMTKHFGNPDCRVKIIPKNGFNEDFSNFSISKQWRFSNSDNWFVSPNLLEHHSMLPDKIQLISDYVDNDSFGFRFIYFLKQSNSSVFIGKSIQIQCIENQYEMRLLIGESLKQTIPVNGELLLIKEKNRIIVWIDGGLYIDQHLPNFQSIELSVKGEVQLQQFMIFYCPEVQVTYRNTLDEETQMVFLATTDKAIVKEKLYDELGRQSITTEPVEIERTSNQSLLSYVRNLVTNGFPNAPDSVWKTGRLKGETNELSGHAFGFSQIIYENNPLNNKQQVKIPGGKFVQNFRSTTSNPFVRAHYPLNKNFTYKVQLKSHQYEKISIFDHKNFKVATYVHNEGGRDLFSTFEYANGMMIKCLPPMHYEKFRIFNETISNEHFEQGIYINYDTNNNPIRMKIPDAAPLEYVYDEANRLRFLIRYDESNITNTLITYFMHDEFGRLTSTGLIKQFYAKDQLLKMNITDINAEEFQHFHYNDFETDPTLRGNIVRSITKNQGGEIIFEESINDFEGKIISKRYLIPNGNEPPEVLMINKRYEGDKLKEILLPATLFGEPFRILYEYNRLGQMKSIGIPGQAGRFVTFTYNAKNQIATEVNHSFQINKFIRTYKYNEAGFLIEIIDPFLVEEVSYTEKSYDDDGYDDGTVSRIKFTAKWHNLADRNEIGIKDDHFQNDFISKMQSRLCYDDLKRRGYLNDNNQQERIFYSKIEVNISSACASNGMERKVKTILGRKGFPKEYGFRFRYDSQMQLIAAKYFVGNDSYESRSFRPETFANEIHEISLKESQNIWNLLTSAGYISYLGNGNRCKEGQRFIRKSLENDLESNNFNHVRYAPPLKKLLMWLFSKNQRNFSLLEMKKYFYYWFNSTLHCDGVYEMLERKKYFENPLESNFMDVLKDYIDYVPAVVGVLQKYFGMELGQSEYDMESLIIDANGNHLNFYSGFKYYKIKYVPNTNQISEINYRNIAVYSEQKYVFKLQHDIRGNVIQALHKSIVMMKYHRVSNRLEEALMTNGNVITFNYDSKGERMSKKLNDRNGNIMSETHYLRDEIGRALVERKLTYIFAGQPPDVLVTVYIYGSRSLVGFVRRDQFYSIFTDHQGSVRLIVRNGEVVAAYDYVPYGNLMRIYGNDPDAHINYRFTGQEWDAELELYNFHARFYDPTIGRFYQIDPRLQYFSPYKYAGNSPVSMLDSNGEFAFILFPIIGLGLLGAYIGGAASNDNFNPFEWNWLSGSTYLGVLVGAATGSMLPYGFIGSMTALQLYFTTFTSATLVTSIGLGTAYMSASAVNNEWNPYNWNITSPKVLNAFFEGFAMGLGSNGGLYGAIEIFLDLRKQYKYIFGTAIAIFGLKSFISGGIDAKWDVNTPSFWLSSMTSVVSAVDLPMIAKTSLNFFRKHIRRFQLSFYISRNSANDYLRAYTALRHHHMSKYKALMEIYRLNASLRILFKSGVKLILATAGFSILSYIIGSLMIGDFDNWDLAHPTTYHNLLSAIQLTAEIFSTSKDALISRERTPRLSPYALRSLRYIANDIRTVRLQALHHSNAATSEFSSLFPQSLYRTAQPAPMVSITDASILVKFSSSISLIYTENDYINLQFLLNINDIRDDVEMNLSLADDLKYALSHAQNALEKNIKDKLRDENLIEWLTYNINLETIFDYDTIRRCATVMLQLFESNMSSIGRDSLRRKLQAINLENLESRAIKQKYFSKENELYSVEMKLAKTSPSYRIRRKFLGKIEHLKKEIKMLKVKEHVSIVDKIEGITDIFWSKLQKYKEMLTKWHYNKKDDYPTVELNEPILKTIPNPNAHDSSNDFNYLSSFKIEHLPELTILQKKCFSCLQATSKFILKFKDFEWLNVNSKKANKSHLQPFAKVVDRTKSEEKSKNVILRRKLREASQSIEEVEGQSSFNQIQKSNLSHFSHGMREQTFQNILLLNNFTNKTEPSKLFSDEEPATNFRNATWNLLNIGDTIMHHMTNNDTLLLTEVLLAKCTNRQLYKPFVANKGSLWTIIDQRKLFCQIIQLYHEMLKESAKTANIAMDRLDLSNIIDLNSKITEIIATKRFKILSSLMTKCALDSLPKTSKNTNGRLSTRKRRKFEISLRDFQLGSKIDNLLSNYYEILEYQ